MKSKVSFLVMISIVAVICTATMSYATENRIVSLVPSQTELLFFLGLGDKVVGVSDYCNYPAEALSKPKVGGMELNIEKIMALKPTILVDVNNMHRKYELLFSQLGLNYVSFTLKKLEQLPQVARELSEILSAPEMGTKFTQIWSEKTGTMELIPIAREVKVYCEIWDTPMQGAGGASYMGEMLEKAGGVNILDKNMDFPVVNHEAIISGNPDVILLSYPVVNVESLKNRPGWKSLKAVKNNHVYSLDQDLFVRPGPRNLEGLKILNNIFKKVQ